MCSTWPLLGLWVCLSFFLIITVAGCTTIAPKHNVWWFCMFNDLQHVTFISTCFEVASWVMIYVLWLLELTCFFFIVQSVHEGRIYTVKLFCDKDYPDKPPSVRFHSRINMTHVNQETGMVKSFSLSSFLILKCHSRLLFFSCGVWFYIHVEYFYHLSNTPCFQPPLHIAISALFLWLRTLYCDEVAR